MIIRKTILISTILALSILPSSADSLSDVTHPKDPSYRVGISELPETRYIQAAFEKTTPAKKYAQIGQTSDVGIADMTYADLSIKRLSKEIAQDLEYEEQDMIADLSLLWQGAAMKSDTINFALYKLANPDADKPDEKSLKKVLKTIASMSTLVGASMGSPILAGSSLIGGNILGIMSQDTKALNYKYTRVNDADMIILIRKVEDLQQNAVNLYYDYMSSKKQLEIATKLAEERGEKFRLAQQNNAARELIVITDAYYRTAMDRQRTAKSEFFSKRAALEQFVGNETFVQFEAELLAREKGETTKPAPPQDNQQAQEDTQAPQTQQPGGELKNDADSNETSTISAQNLTNLPQLRLPSEDIQTEEDNEENEPEVLTGPSSSIEPIEDEGNNLTEGAQPNKKQLKRQKKKQKIKQPKPEKVKQKKEKKDPLKGFIFLHGQDKYSIQTTQTQNVSQKQPQQAQGTQTNEIAPIQSVSAPQTLSQEYVNSLGLPPLDEIRVPDLTRGGYSIHSELLY